MDKGAWQTIVHGVTRVAHDLATIPPLQKKKKKRREHREDYLLTHLMKY